VNFSTYNFMKKYTVNFTQAMFPGAKKIPPKLAWAGFLYLNRVSGSLPLAAQATGIIGSADASAVARSAAGG
jgi:hypothetical protein